MKTIFLASLSFSLSCSICLTICHFVIYSWRPFLIQQFEFQPFSWNIITLWWHSPPTYSYFLSVSRSIDRSFPFFGNFISCHSSAQSLLDSISFACLSLFSSFSVSPFHFISAHFLRSVGKDTPCPGTQVNGLSHARIESNRLIWKSIAQLEHHDQQRRHSHQINWDNVIWFRLYWVFFDHISFR